MTDQSDEQSPLDEIRSAYSAIAKERAAEAREELEGRSEEEMKRPSISYVDACDDPNLFGPWFSADSWKTVARDR
jgi:hypothetical protein